MELGRKLGWGMVLGVGVGGWRLGMVGLGVGEVGRAVGCGGLMVLLWSGAKRDVGGGR
jgi:hypothetical protein